MADRKLVEKTAQIGLDAVTISLKAFNQEDYQFLTGADVFEKVKQAVINIQQTAIRSVVNITLSQETMRKSTQLIDFMRITGAKHFSLDTGKPIILPDGKTNVDGMGTPSELAGYFMSAYHLFKTIPDIGFTFKIAIPFCLFPEAFLEEILCGGNIMTGCQMATGSGLIIDPDGNIIPCNHLCHLALGNISEIKSEADYLRFRDNPIIDSFYAKSSCCPSARCQSCKYWQICGSGCRLYWLHYGKDELQDSFSRKEVKAL